MRAAVSDGVSETAAVRARVSATGLNTWHESHVTTRVRSHAHVCGGQTPAPEQGSCAVRQSRPGNKAMAPRRATVCLLLAALVCAATATIFLEEKFDDGAPCCPVQAPPVVGPRSGTGRCGVKAPVTSAACWLYHLPHCGAAAVAAQWVAVAACGLTQAGRRGRGRGCFRTFFADHCPSGVTPPPRCRLGEAVGEEQLEGEGRHRGRLDADSRQVVRRREG